jgi:hypothetical protein
MKKILIETAVIAALSLTGLAAHAGCADPRAGSPGAAQITAPLNLRQGAVTSHFGLSAIEAIVGTWHVAYTQGGAPFADAFIQWHSDGTEWENINLPVLGGGLCMGSWKALDRWHVYRNHYGWLFTDGTLTGYFNETETDLLAPDGNSYTGTNTTEVYDLTGKLQASVPGTSAATKIEP